MIDQKMYRCDMCDGEGERIKLYDCRKPNVPIPAVVPIPSYCELCDGTGRVSDYRKAMLEDRVVRLERLMAEGIDSNKELEEE